MSKNFDKYRIASTFICIYLAIFIRSYIHVMEEGFHPIIHVLGWSV